MEVVHKVVHKVETKRSERPAAMVTQSGQTVTDRCCLYLMTQEGYHSPHINTPPRRFWTEHCPLWTGHLEDVCLNSVTQQVISFLSIYLMGKKELDQWCWRILT